MSETNATYGHNKLVILSSIRDPEQNKTYTADKTLTCESEGSNPCLMEKQGNTFSYLYNVVETDHFGYAIVQECKSYMGIWHESHVFVMTRDKAPC